MAGPNKALGNVARQANKKRRRERILDIAKNLISTNGLEAFTLSQLADEAGGNFAYDPQLVWQEKRYCRRACCGDD